ncbi:MAG: excinuclease ABC subunit UvrC [Candidatus Daviesbacteria bacterium]|nr:excinuclease ABC subunit UvrC [Candidatus Daviesbacteria bacterium]
MLPSSPGVYIFKDKQGQVLYVGKAIDLRSRVASYKRSDNPKTQKLNSKTTKVETIVVESELEALILEVNFIKKYLPPFNVRLIDDKDYLYIAISEDDFPKVITARKNNLTKKFWGPFPSSRTVRETLKSLRKVFPWCSASQGVPLQLKPCFYYHLGLCQGACTGEITKEDYRKIINGFSKFMDGKKDQLISDLTKEMKLASERQNFEEAAKIKKNIQGILYLTQANRTKLYLENPNFLEQESKVALEELQKDLNLKKLPERIEGYDISNIQGKEATGSMVVLTKGEIDKSQYRKFKIKISDKTNDIAMHREILQRRMRHTEWPMPDLIIIDGGRGQARAVMTTIPVFGIAKKMEWLYPPQGEVIKLSRKSLSLKLLQKLRDEAHRFAISYHRKLRGKIIFK